ncbi:DsbE family thiol:disulfide interchange protein [Pseudohongiella acticola]|jgi:cytochrome c biogenesis protein CcmG, thiol:disulfide interchange protein DsbE|uniref:DsbE family thiol:disulfide interchange protein n=1 Tax=Pseudohongiella acticola TaxID=1524254 RepID=UPI0030EB650D
MKNLKLYLPVIGFAALAVLMWRGLYLDSRTLPSMLLDRPLPEFELRALETGDQLLSVQDLPDEPFILNIWGSYCLPCLQENPIFMAAKEADVIPIIGVNYKDTDAAAREWLDDNGNPFTLSIIDDTGRYGIDLGVYGAPETFIVDAQGVIRYKHIGVIDYQAWDEEILPVIDAVQAEAGS